MDYIYLNHVTPINEVFEHDYFDVSKAVETMKHLNALEKTEKLSSDTLDEERTILKTEIKHYRSEFNAKLYDKIGNDLLSSYLYFNDSKTDQWIRTLSGFKMEMTSCSFEEARKDAYKTIKTSIQFVINENAKNGYPIEKESFQNDVFVSSVYRNEMRESFEKQSKNENKKSFKI